MNTIVIATFLAVGIYSAAGVFKDQSRFSLNKTFWFFNLFFLSLAPLFQYLSNYKPWPEGKDISDETYALANLIILIFFLAYSFAKKLRVVKLTFARPGIPAPTSANSHVYLLMGLSLACFATLCATIGFESLFFRASNRLSAADEQIINLGITSFLRIIPLASLAIIKLAPGPKRVGHRACELTLLSIVVASNFPTSVTRFWCGSVLIGLFVIYFCAKSRFTRLYDSLFVLVFCLVFPVFFMFKYVNINEVDVAHVAEQVDLRNSFNSVDFDAYFMLIQGINHVSEIGVNLGESVLTTATSFVPRSIYPDKGQPSPYVVGKTQGLYYLELSFPLVAEGYLAMGLLGVILFAAIIGYAIKCLDASYWRNVAAGSFNSAVVIYPFLLGLLIYVLRGSLYAGFVQTVLFIAPFYVVYGLKRIRFV